MLRILGRRALSQLPRSVIVAGKQPQTVCKQMGGPVSHNTLLTKTGGGQNLALGPFFADSCSRRTQDLASSGSGRSCGPDPVAQSWNWVRASEALTSATKFKGAPKTQQSR